MKVTKSYIKQIIKEELNAVLNESAPSEEVVGIMNYLKPYWIFPFNEEDYNKHNFPGSEDPHTGEPLPQTFAEFKEKIKADTGANFEKVLSIYKTHKHSDSYNDPEKRASLGQHDQHNTVKPYNWDKQSPTDYGMVNRKRMAASARKYGVGDAIRRGTLKEAMQLADFYQDAQKIINALLVKGPEWTANAMRSSGRDTFYDYFGDVTLAAAYEQIKGRDNDATIKIKKRFAGLLQNALRDKFGGDEDLYKFSFRTVDIELYKGVNNEY